ncbi:MAG: hypothetical protein ACI9MC_000875 [Kiritimatiellia bacterium]|jgi:hypothetical protein
MKMITRGFIACSVLASAALATTSLAADTKGKAVTVHVIDEFGRPLTNARVRVPGTEGKTLVNHNGEWTESLLYTIEGDEFAFERGEHLILNVSAPEYHARAVKYKVRGRVNYIEVPLRRMPEPTAPLKEKEVQDELVRWFSRTAVRAVPEDGGAEKDVEGTPDTPPATDEPEDK